MASRASGRGRHTDAQLRSIMARARCILWDAEVVGLEGWEQEAEKYLFDWSLHIWDEQAAQHVVPLELAPGQSYTDAWVRARNIEDARRADQISGAAFRAGNSHYSQEFRCTDRNGTQRWIFEDVFIEWLGPGRWHAVGVCTDVTEHKRADEARKSLEHEHAARIEAESANRLKDQFLAVLSHELRTPLTPVLAAANALEMQTDLSPEVRADIQTIRRNVELEARLIDDLLDLTRIAKGKLQLHLRPVDAHQLIADTLDICREDIEAARLKVSLELNADCCRLRADPPRLQ